MINFVSKRKYYYIASTLLVSVSLLTIAVFGLKFSIDFAGGSELTFSNDANIDQVRQIITENGIEIYSELEGDSTYVLSTQEIDQDLRENIEAELLDIYQIDVEAFETIGPVIGDETKVKAIQAVAIATVAILVYIAITFRHVSLPVASWKYGTVAIVALFHDVIITVGAFAIFGVLWGVEIDPLFITAILTIMGFSVHDTIVTFDRIRENLKNNTKKAPFPEIVNKSIVETITRSINTSMTVLFVIVALLLFGGDSLRWFIVTLLIGVVVGVYSSVFTASQLLVTWYEWDRKRGKKK